MSDMESSPGTTGDDEQVHDQDSEPTMNAPEEGRPDGLEALKDGETDDTDATGGDGSPS